MSEYAALSALLLLALYSPQRITQSLPKLNQEAFEYLFGDEVFVGHLSLGAWSDGYKLFYGLRP